MAASVSSPAPHSSPQRFIVQDAEISTFSNACSSRKKVVDWPYLLHPPLLTSSGERLQESFGNASSCPIRAAGNTARLVIERRVAFHIVQKPELPWQLRLMAITSQNTRGQCCIVHHDIETLVVIVSLHGAGPALAVTAKLEPATVMGLQ